MFQPWTIFACSAVSIGIGTIAYYSRRGMLLADRSAHIVAAAFILTVLPAMPEIRHAIWVEHSYCDRLTYVANEDHCPANQRTGIYPWETVPDYAVTQDDPAAPTP